MNSLQKLFLAPVAAVTLMLAACSQAGSVSEWKTITDARWPYGDTLVYNCGAQPDSLLANELIMTIRHTDGYAYANLWLELTYLNNDSLVADTFNIALADEFGHWRGNGNGVSFQFTDTLRPARVIDVASPLRLRHVMRVDTLSEIEQIGLTF